MTSRAEPVGNLRVALEHARRLLKTRPLLAAQQAQEILSAIPNQPLASLLLGTARRIGGTPANALTILEPLSAAHPRWDVAHYELGLALIAVGRSDEALLAFRRAVATNPHFVDAWLALADELHARGDRESADAAYAEHLKASTSDPRLVAAAAALCDNRLPEAETLLREHLKRSPTDVAAIRMFAEVAARMGRYSDAEALLTRCLDLSPSFSGARHNFAVVLNRNNKPAQALQEIERLLAEDPHHPSIRNLQAVVVARVGDVQKSIDIYAGLLAQYSDHAPVWMSYGHALKTAGRQNDSISAYRKAIALQPHLGEAYWSLANLKTLRFTGDDCGAMQAQLARTDLTATDRLHFHFALGKALEDAAQFSDSFQHYTAANALRREAIYYSHQDTTAHVRRSREHLTSALFDRHRDSGSPSTDPIFIVGLPRSGSTLIEQILSSHSAVEGTTELHDIGTIAQALDRRAQRNGLPGYLDLVATLDPNELSTLGEHYISQTKIHRHTNAPFFIDKMPNNFRHLGLIRLILPHAKIIDARRHPMAACFSCFKQHFAQGQHFTYGLEDIGLYYRDYVDLMQHIDTTLPGWVHRVDYEVMIENTEHEVRRLLEACGLPFEAACLRFYENDRAVRTASSEQVRMPIFRDGLDQWHHYEPWLDPLKTALGPALVT